MKITPVDELAARHEAKTWLKAAQHLNDRGLAACVPCELLNWLQRRGVDAWCQERAA